MTLLEVAKIYVKSQLCLWLAASAVNRLNLSYPWINHLQQERFIGADFMQYCLKAQELNASRNYWNQQIKTKQDNSSKTYLM